VKRVAFRVVEVALFAGAPALLTSVCLLTIVERPRSDFWTFWRAGRDVLHGRSPYPALTALPHEAYSTFAPFVYPPVTAFAMAPLSVLPFDVAKLIYFALAVASLALGLRLLGVRDWRCYGAAFLAPVVYSANGLGAIGPFLLLGIAAAWRYRDRAVVCGLLVAYVVTAKLFLWPLWFWLVRVRRFRAAAVAAGAGVVAVATSWAAIGFQGAREYPTLLARLTELEGPHSYSVYSLGRALGVGSVAAERVQYAVAFLALAAVAVFVSGDRRVLVAVLGVALVATPILWPHYLVLLFVPIAFVSPTFSPLWLAPVALWLDVSAWSHGNPLRIVFELVVCAVVVRAAVHRSLPPGQRAASGTTRLRSSECLQPTGATSSVI
jgi:hypothetical protein